MWLKPFRSMPELAPVYGSIFKNIHDQYWFEPRSQESLETDMSDNWDVMFSIATKAAS